MHILIDSGSYHALNVGDVAMLQAAVLRLSHLLPNASIAAVTNAPATLAVHCPGVEAVPLAGRVAFLTDRFAGRADEVLPAAWRARLERLEDGFRRQSPSGLSWFIAAKRAIALRHDWSAPHDYVDAIRRADLVVASGAGVFTDAFLENAQGVLTTLELARQFGVPTALMGQGLGPVANQTLRAKMAAVLPRVDLIALRERSESLRLLETLGVSPEKVVVTGDDAIEMANRHTPDALGAAIGVNLRIAGYAGTSGRAIEVIRPAVQEARRQLGAALVAIPIAHHPDCHDGVAIRQVLSDHASEEPLVELNTPVDAIVQTSRCRVVVTGSYHAAVFALAQGIPVVALAATQYYRDKFAGLAELFPHGCTIVALDRADAQAALKSAIVDAWNDAPVLRDSLLQAAARQIAQGRDAYRRLASLARIDVASPAVTPRQRAEEDELPDGVTVR
jgi:colanic acid/amylovoran biosynthesis protein